MNRTLVYCAIAGIIALVGDLVFAGRTQLFLRSLTFSVFGIVFLWGFKILGEKTCNSLLRNTAIANVIYVIMFTLNISPLLRQFISPKVFTAYIIIPGIIAIFSGIALLRLTAVIGYIAKITGVLAILAGICMVTIRFNPLGVAISRFENILSVAILLKVAGKGEFL